MAASRRILLVEDEPTLQRILGSVLSDAGHTVETVATAEAALERLDDASQPDIELVLSDKNLPAMNGLDLLQAIRERDKKSGAARGFVLVTGYPSRESAQTVLALGGDGYLVKPFRSLVHAIQAIEVILAAPIAERRQASLLANRVVEVAAGSAMLKSANKIALSIDDPPLHARVTAALAARGADLVDHETLAAITDVTPRAFIAGRVEDLVAHRAKDAAAALVLVDGAASFNAILELIHAGGGAVLDPSRVTGGGA